MKKGILKFVLLAMGLQSISTLAHAQMSGLPYIGTRTAVCNVNLPETMRDVDAGYLADETCDNIFVFPPLLGSLKISVPSYIDTQYCPLISSLKANLPTSPANASISERAKFARETAEMDRSIESIGNGRPFSSFGFEASLKWDDLVDAYKVANSQEKLGRKLTVNRLPILNGVVDASTVGVDGQTKKNGPLTKLQLFGPKQKISANDDTATADFLRKITADLDTKDMVVFNGSVGGKMQLSLDGTCSVFDVNGNPVAKNKADALSAFAGTYTYFYPVQTKASYGVRFDNAQLTQSIMTFLRANGGKVTDEQIIQAFKDTPTIQIVKEGRVSADDEGDQLEKDYKTQLKEFTARSIVSLIADRITNDVNNSTYTQTVEHTVRQCHSSWIVFSSCDTHIYYVTTQKIDWDTVRAKLGSILTSTAGTVSYKNIYLFGTSAFANVTGQP